MIYNIAEDLGNITNVSKHMYNQIFSKIIPVISHNLLEALNKGENTIVLDVGIGTLALKYFDNELKYKFEPSYKLEKVLSDTINSNKDYLLEEAETSLREKINSSYKDLF